MEIGARPSIPDHPVLLRGAEDIRGEARRVVVESFRLDVPEVLGKDSLPVDVPLNHIGIELPGEVRAKAAEVEHPPGGKAEALAEGGRVEGRSRIVRRLP